MLMRSIRNGIQSVEGIRYRYLYLCGTLYRGGTYGTCERGLVLKVNCKEFKMYLTYLALAVPVLLVTIKLQCAPKMWSLLDFFASAICCV